jgi:hypothetical protein
MDGEADRCCPYPLARGRSVAAERPCNLDRVAGDPWCGRNYLNKKGVERTAEGRQLGITDSYIMVLGMRLVRFWVVF